MNRPVPIQGVDLDELAARLAAALEVGELVAVPTETVYGILARGDLERATRALADIKGRDRDKPNAVYVAGPEDVRRVTEDLPAAALRLMSAFWPGPLTLIVPTPDGTVGLRCTSHPLVLRLVSRCDFPVVGTSANLAGEPPLSRARDISAAFGEALALVVEDDEAPSGAASSVVRVEADGRWTAIRLGELDERMLAEELAPRVLHVCTGNTCRSPMAQALHEAAVAAGIGDPRTRVYSAGLAASPGSPPSRGAVEVMRERGLDISGHRSRAVSLDLLERMDEIIAMTAAHQVALLRLAPHLAPRVRVLRPGRDVADPYGADLDSYRECAREIDAALEDLITEKDR